MSLGRQHTKDCAKLSWITEREGSINCWMCLAAMMDSVMCKKLVRITSVMCSRSSAC